MPAIVRVYNNQTSVLVEGLALVASYASAAAASAASASDSATGMAGLLGGAAVSAQQLKDWTEAESYELTAVTYDSATLLPTTATVKWPDGSAGTFTPTAVNSTFNAIDAFTISHTASGKTVTQAAVTRNSNGQVTTKPALTVA